MLNFLKRKREIAGQFAKKSPLANIQDNGKKAKDAAAVREIAQTGFPKAVWQSLHFLAFPVRPLVKDTPDCYLLKKKIKVFALGRSAPGGITIYQSSGSDWAQRRRRRRCCSNSEENSGFMIFWSSRQRERERERERAQKTGAEVQKLWVRCSEFFFAF